RLADYIESHLEQPLELGSLAELAALSEYHFARMFRVSFGLPPHRYVLERRLARARDLLAYSAQSLQEVSLACGFASPSHFNRRFREAHGATPGQYRAALKGS
ncbi:helix-turn-helix transcriptional regulator, partial [Pseudomonas aeruginosa]|nr:helix-turn-helix transcriptional regulator [Pseudomonas aeruginosa]MBF3327823.1 helix-turn-helix transcriptional regulator [Pseudomonas aeruginosa]